MYEINPKALTQRLTWEQRFDVLNILMLSLGVTRKDRFTYMLVSDKSMKVDESRTSN